MKFRIILLLSILVLLMMWFWSIKDQDAKIIFCDVGQGDGIIVKKFDEEMVIDTGPNNKKMLDCLSRELPFWDKTIEAMILSHSDTDHTGGLKDVLKSYRVNEIFSNDKLEVTSEQNMYSKKLSQGDMIKFGLINFEVVNPFDFEKKSEDNNDNSIAGILSYKDIKIFLSGDISKEVEQRLVWQAVLRQGSGSVDILKVSHHGSETATSDELLNILKPKLAIISVGKNNKFNHPNESVLKRLKSNNVLIKRTDEEGNIIIKLEE